MARRPLIDTSAMQRVDFTALQLALQVHSKSVLELERAHARKVQLEGEVEQLLATVDPVDERAMGEITFRRTQLDVLPHYVGRSERQLDEVICPRLLAEAEAVRTQLVRFYEGSLEAVVSQLRDYLSPFFADFTDEGTGEVRPVLREIALRSEPARAVELQLHRVRSIILPMQPRSNGPEQWDRSVLDAARALIAIAEARE